MMDSYFNNADELWERFQSSVALEPRSRYFDYAPLRDRIVGFSLQRNYPSEIRFKPPKRTNGEDDTVALIHVIYLHPQEFKMSSHEGRVPFALRITAFSRYLSEHADYSFSDEDCPTRDSVLLSRRTPEPLEIQSYGRYFYNHSSNSFEDEKAQSLSGKDILDRLFKSHCDTTKPLRRVWPEFDFRMTWRLFAFLGSIVDFLKAILRILFGRHIESTETGTGFLKPYRREDMKLLRADSIEFFGYKAPKNLVLLYSLALAALFTGAYIRRMQDGFIYAVAASDVISLAFSIIILWILEAAFPRLLLSLINLLVRVKIRVIAHRLEQNR